jgi:hypothetical protein
VRGADEEENEATPRSRANMHACCGSGSTLSRYRDGSTRSTSEDSGAACVHALLPDDPAVDDSRVVFKPQPEATMEETLNMCTPSSSLTTSYSDEFSETTRANLSSRAPLFQPRPRAQTGLFVLIGVCTSSSLPCDPSTCGVGLGEPRPTLL